MVFGLLALSFAGATVSAAQPDAQAIKTYLMAHPEVILEALEKQKVALYDMVVAGQQIKQRIAWRENIKRSLANPLKPAINPERPRLGNPQAPTLVVEYTNFMCSTCRKGAVALEDLLGKYPIKYQALIKHVPNDDISRQIALYYEAIARQSTGKAYVFYHQVFERQPELTKNGLLPVLDIVKGLKLDQARLARDLSDPILAQRIKDDTAESKAFNLGGTPAFIVAGVLLRGPAPVAAFEDIWYLSKGKQPPTSNN